MPWFSVVATALLALAACGGGTGGGTGGGSGVRVTVDTANLSAQAKVTDEATLPLAVTITASGIPGSGLYVRGSSTQNGVGSLTIGEETSKSFQVLVLLKAPYQLAPGTYTDTVKLEVCTDESCTRQVAGSPASVAVQYVVTAVTGPSAPALVVPTTSYLAQALPTDVSAPTESNPAITVQNVPTFPIHLTFSYTSNGVASATLPDFFRPGSPGSLNGAPLTIRYRKPAELGPGLYEDTVTVTACLDQECVNPLAGSPTTIRTKYQVGNDLPGPDGYAVSMVPLQANDLVWDPVHSVLYVATAANSAQHPSSIVTVNPVTGAILGSIGLGAEPALFAISGGSEYLYVAVKGKSSIRRFTLPALMLDATIDIGTDPRFALATWDLYVAPRSPRTIAVARTIAPNPPQPHGVVIIDDRTPRPKIAGLDGLNTLNRIEYIQWGADSGTLYGVDPVSSAGQLASMKVDESGANITATAPQLPAGRMHFLNGLLYFDGGSVFDPVAGVQVGALPGAPVAGKPFIRGFVAVDGASSRVFRLSDNGGGAQTFVEIYGLASYELIKRFTVVGHPLSMRPYATRLLRWGVNGLAYAASDGTIVIIQGAFLTSD